MVMHSCRWDGRVTSARCSCRARAASMWATCCSLAPGDASCTRRCPWQGLTNKACCPGPDCLQGHAGRSLVQALSRETQPAAGLRSCLLVWTTCTVHAALWWRHCSRPGMFKHCHARLLHACSFCSAAAAAAGARGSCSAQVSCDAAADQGVRVGGTSCCSSSTPLDGTRVRL